MKDKVVLITGASSGIGKELSYAFAGEGAKLVLSDLREEELIVVKDNCLNMQRIGKDENIMILPLDLSDTNNIEYETEQVIKRFGKIDILINNAGISQRSLVRETSLAVDRKIMEVNFFGTVALTKSVLHYMLANKSGHIVVISSMVGKFGFPLRSAYSASKHALHGFFESLRAELFDDNIKVTIVCPGRVSTNISLNALTKDGEKYNKMDAGQADGIPAGQCAKKIIKAIRKNKQEVLIGGKEIMLIHIKRFLPELCSKLVRKVKAT
ncbi:MAG: SDR family oxidoreductase [Bacteroidota bacterium]